MMGLGLLLLAAGISSCINGATPDCSADAGSPCGPGFDAGDAGIDAILAMLMDSGKDATMLQDGGETDAEGTDAEGTDAEGMDAEGMDAEHMDAEGMDAEGADAPADAPPADAGASDSGMTG
jgi:hypothetical protein